MGKRKVKILLFIDDMSYIENPEESTNYKNMCTSWNHLIQVIYLDISIPAAEKKIENDIIKAIQ